MSTAFQRLVFIWGIAAALAPASAQAQPLPLPSEVTLDIDHDGIMDRAVLVDARAQGSADLAVYLGVGAGKLDPDRKPAIVKKNITTGHLLRFEGTAKGSLIVMSGCGGCSDDYETTLTIVYRGGRFLVGGVTYGWDTRTALGTCDVNFLIGTGLRSDGLGIPAKPIKGHFKPTKLADWSQDNRPKACN